VEQVSHTGHRADFRRYAVSCFIPHLFAGASQPGSGCGATALALLTGVPPQAIAAKNGSRHYADSFMIRFLRRRGFLVMELTRSNVPASSSSLGNNHVLLISQLFQPDEGTWGVIFNRTWYHNFDCYALDLLSFLNKPILSAYVVVHSRWRKGQPVGPRTKPKSRASGLTLDDLH
jgi:hypothetical protein